MLDVREVMNFDEPIKVEPVKEIPEIPCMIKSKPINTDAAYQRIRILKETLKLLEVDLNNTDTNDMSDALALEYGFLKMKFKAIINSEMELIKEGL